MTGGFNVKPQALEDGAGELSPIAEALTTAGGSSSSALQDAQGAAGAPELEAALAAAAGTAKDALGKAAKLVSSLGSGLRANGRNYTQSDADAQAHFRRLTS